MALPVAVAAIVIHVPPLHDGVGRFVFVQGLAVERAEHSARQQRVEEEDDEDVEAARRNMIRGMSRQEETEKRDHTTARKDKELKMSKNMNEE